MNCNFRFFLFRVIHGPEVFSVPEAKDLSGFGADFYNMNTVHCDLFTTCFNTPTKSSVLQLGPWTSTDWFSHQLLYSGSHISMITMVDITNKYDLSLQKESIVENATHAHPALTDSLHSRAWAVRTWIGWQLTWFFAIHFVLASLHDPKWKLSSANDIRGWFCFVCSSQSSRCMDWRRKHGSHRSVLSPGLVHTRWTPYRDWYTGHTEQLECTDRVEACGFETRKLLQIFIRRN